MESVLWPAQRHPPYYELGGNPSSREHTKNTRVFHFPYFCDPETFYPLRNRAEEYDISYTGNYKQHWVPQLGQVDVGPATKEARFNMIVDPLAQVYKERLDLSHDIVESPPGSHWGVSIFWSELKSVYDYKELVKNPALGWGGIKLIWK